VPEDHEPVEAVASDSAGTSESNTTPAAAERAVSLLGDVTLPVEVRLGEAELPIEELLELRQGSVVALDHSPNDPVDLIIGSRVVARGEVVLVNGELGVRVTEILEHDKQ